MIPTLFIVATPIGNLEDVTLRALRILREVDIILAEDTRVTRKLLEKYGISTPLLSYHTQSGVAKLDKILALLEARKNLALVSDSGTPTVSDPGSRLVSEVKRRFGDRVLVIPVPGPSALLAALSATGVPASEFLFLGFLPHKKGRKKIFRDIAESDRTVVFYESPHRILKTLLALSIAAPRARVTIAREMTKIHEEFIQGVSEELLKRYESHPDNVRGEFVVIVDRP